MTGSIVSYSGVYSQPPKPLDNLVKTAEDTVRRTNLQAAAKTPGGAALAAAKYIATDVIKENLPKVIPEAKYLNTQAAVNAYKK